MTLRRGSELERFAGADVTYREIGATAWPAMPGGYRIVKHRAMLGVGRASFDLAADALVSWEMHRRTGLRVAATAPRAVPDAVAVMSIGVGPLRLVAPCRVMYAVDDPRRKGFAYGTLPGHPESGEESFIVEHEENDEVSFTVQAFSRHATRLARLGGPLTSLAQDLATRRYARVLRSFA
jgi:uncharacterized protein (UPF0548 family)